MKNNYIRTLSKDFWNLLKNSNDCDVKIRVGQEPNIVEFKAHSLFLSARSNYFRKKLSARKDGEIIIFDKPSISPLAFEVLIKYIYTGILSTKNNKISPIDIIIIADELELIEIYQQLEEQLLKNDSDWRFPKDFITICQNSHLTNLHRVAFGLVCRSPKIIFGSREFFKMEEAHLIELLKCDNLDLKEIEIWDYLIKWGINSTNSLLDHDFTKWSQTDFKNLEKTLHNCIPHIRFSQMSLEDYAKVRHSFKSILPDGFDDEVVQYLRNCNSGFQSNNSERFFFDTLPLRVSAYPFDSKIINASDATLIANWIDKKVRLDQIRDMKFEFKLIYRASHESSKVKHFHNNCDNKGPTVVVIKVQNSGEIIGGYNPFGWSRIFDGVTSKSFIFSLKSIPVLSRVIAKESSIVWHERKGPCFGLHDLWIQHHDSDIVGTSKQHSYAKKIIDRETFYVEDYEVFQIIDKRPVCQIN